MATPQIGQTFLARDKITTVTISAVESDMQDSWDNEFKVLGTNYNSSRWVIIDWDLVNLRWREIQHNTGAGSDKMWDPGIIKDK